jgi:hypothetical protein
LDRHPRVDLVEQQSVPRQAIFSGVLARCASFSSRHAQAVRKPGHAGRIASSPLEDIAAELSNLIITQHHATRLRGEHQDHHHP